METTWKQLPYRQRNMLPDEWFWVFFRRNSHPYFLLNFPTNSLCAEKKKSKPVFTSALHYPMTLDVLSD